jgi:hypothetical protein
MNRPLLLVLPALAVVLAPAVRAQPYSWDLSTVDPNPSSGNWLSLRLEPAGIGHVAFWTIGLGVRYGVRQGDSWTLETLPDAGVPPGVPVAAAAGGPAPPDETNLIQTTSVALALAPGGSPWIAEIDHGRVTHSNVGPIAVRHREAGVWVTEWVGESGNPALLAADAAGVLHAAWDTYGTNTVTYARRTGPDTWETEIAVPSGSVGAMKLAADGAVHLAVVGGGIVQHVLRAPGGGWTVTPVAGPLLEFHTIGVSDLELDAAGRPAIATQERDPLFPRTHLRLHRFDGASWAHEDVDVDATTKAGGVIVFDAEGSPRVAYLRSAESNFVVASAGPSGWAWTVVDPVGNGNQGMDGASDAMGRPWFATATQSVGVRLAIGQPTVGVPVAPVDAGTWLGAPSPQPARAGVELGLAFRAARAGTMTFETVDARGAVRRKEARAVEAGAGTVRLPTHGLAPGVYWIRARDAAGRIAARRFVLAG